MALLPSCGGETGAVPTGPYEVAVESSQRGTDAGSVAYDLYIPQPTDDLPSPPWPAVILTHGFARGKEQMRYNALYMAQRGIVVLAPDLSGLREGEPAQLRNIANTVDHIAWLARRSQAQGDALHGLIDPARIGLVGHSAGGSICLEAAIDLQTTATPAAAVLLLDAVPWDRTLTRAGELAKVPFASVRSEPSDCNRNGQIAEVLASLGFAVPDVQVVGATHCDIENPTDSLCKIPCGGTGTGQREIYQHLMYLFVRDALDGPLLEDEMDTYVTTITRFASEGRVVVE